MRTLKDLWMILRHDPAAMTGFVIVCLYIIMAVAGPFVPVTHNENPLLAYEPPSFRHLLGTDYAGRDTLSEIVNGSTPVLIVAVIASAFSVIVGVIIGLSAGILRGIGDTILMRLADIFLTIPSLPLVIVLVTFIHSSSPFVLAMLISITGWAGLARSIRSQALSLSKRDFVESASVQGLSFWNILSRQLLPNMGSYVAMSFLLGITGAIYAEVGLYLLGIAPFTASNWGVMLNFAINQAGAIYTSQSLLYLLSPMFAIVILQIGFVLFTRALDQLFNPRIRTGWSTKKTSTKNMTRGEGASL